MKTGAVRTAQKCPDCGQMLWYYPFVHGGSGALFCYVQSWCGILDGLKTAYLADRATPDGGRYWPRADVGCAPRS